MKYVYDNIKFIRKQKELTLADMADKLDMYPSNYRKLERGFTQLTIERLEQIALVFEMSVVEVVTYSDANYRALHQKLAGLEKENEALKQENSFLKTQLEDKKRENEVLHEYNKLLKKQVKEKKDKGGSK